MVQVLVTTVIVSRRPERQSSPQTPHPRPGPPEDTVFRSTIARTLIVTAVVAGGFAIGAPAFAADNTPGPDGLGGCPVVNTDDNGHETTIYIPNGQKWAGLTCKDGTWVYVPKTAPTGVKTVQGHLATIRR
jgi:hypothetical protein